MAIFLGNSNGGPGGGGGSYTAGDGITIASNVISLGGTISNNVNLNLNSAGYFSLRDIATNFNGFNFEPAQFDITYKNGSNQSSIQSPGNYIGLRSSSENAEFTYVYLDPNYVFLQYRDTAENFKQILIGSDSQSTGILITDQIDAIGLLGEADYSTNATTINNAYAQVSTVKTLISQNTVTPNVYSIDTPGQTSTQTIGSITVSNPAIYRVNVYGLWRSGLGSVDIQINYTNLNSVPVTIDLSSVAVGNENLNSPAYVIKSAGGGAVIEVVATLTGDGIYDCGLTIELLF
jgi:hypothetical protein